MFILVLFLTMFNFLRVGRQNRDSRVLKGGIRPRYPIGDTQERGTSGSCMLPAAVEKDGWGIGSAKLHNSKFSTSQKTASGSTPSLISKAYRRDSGVFEEIFASCPSTTNRMRHYPANITQDPSNARLTSTSHAVMKSSLNARTLTRSFADLRARFARLVSGQARLALLRARAPAPTSARSMADWMGGGGERGTHWAHVMCEDAIGKQHGRTENSAWRLIARSGVGVRCQSWGETRGKKANG